MAWQGEIAEWWELYAKKSGQAEERPRPYPYLKVTRPSVDVIQGVHAGEAQDRTFIVRNEGNFPAWTCYVEIYELESLWVVSLSDCELREQTTVITLQPGEQCDVTVRVMSQVVGAWIVAACYDPLLDPIDFGQPSSRHCTAIAFVAP